MKPSQKLLLFLTIGVLLLPFALSLTPWANTQPLNGEYKKAEKPVLSFEALYTGNYPKQVTHYYNEQFGFRNSLVRVFHQIGFSLLNQAFAGGVRVGSNQFLFDTDHYKSYAGEDRIDTSLMLEKVNLLWQLNTLLKQNNKFLQIILAPSKTRALPMYAETNYGTEGKRNNYQLFQNTIRQKPIALLDVCNWMPELKNKYGAEALFPKTGMHWSQLLSALVFDSLLKTLSTQQHELVGGLEFGEPYSAPMALNKIDNDLERTLNLLWPIANQTHYYLPYTIKPANKKLHYLFVADSYLYNFPLDSFEARLGSYTFLYYNNTFSKSNGEKGTVTKELVGNAVKEADVVVLLCSEPNLPKFDWGFSKMAMEANDFNDAKVKSIIERIKSDKAWLQIVKQKAKEKNISTDSMLRMDALYLLNQQP